MLHPSSRISFGGKMNAFGPRAAIDCRFDKQLHPIVACVPIAAHRWPGRSFGNPKEKWCLKAEVRMFIMMSGG